MTLSKPCLQNKRQFITTIKACRKFCILLIPGPNKTIALHHVFHYRNCNEIVSWVYIFYAFDPIKNLYIYKLIAPLKIPTRKTGKIFLSSWANFCAHDASEEFLNQLEGEGKDKTSNVSPPFSSSLCSLRQPSTILRKSIPSQEVFLGQPPSSYRFKEATTTTNSFRSIFFRFLASSRQWPTAIPKITPLYTQR